MKKLVFLIIASVALGAFADTWKDSSGKEWSYTVADGNATITGVSSVGGVIAIPLSVNGYPVSSIGSSAFRDRSFTGVTIPGSVTSIGEYAFYCCSGLTSVTIPSGVKSIGDYAFYGCRGLTSVTIPSGVTSIGNSALRGCSSLTSVTISSSEVSIGTDVFYGCSNVKDAMVPGWLCGIPVGGVTNIVITSGTASVRNGAFLDCSGLTSVTIPDSVTNIGDKAFYECSGLTSVTIPDGVTSIGEGAFYNCIGLTSVTMSVGVTRIGSYAFKGCNGLREVHVFDVAAWCGILFSDGESNPLCCAKTLYLNDDPVTNLVIPDGVEAIGKYAFWNCTNIVSTTILNGVTSIGYGAFYNCRGLTSVTIPDSVTSIGGYAFSGCSGLTSVTIPDSVTSIGYAAFSGCSGLTSVTIPQCICSGRMADVFPAALTNLKSVTIADSVTNISDEAFGGFSALITINVGEANQNYASEHGLLLSKDRQTLVQGVNGDVVIPDSVITIRNNSFSGLDGLTSVMIPYNVTSIGANTFSGCSALTNLVLSSCVTNVSGNAFDGCRAIRRLEMKDMTGLSGRFAVTTAWTRDESIKYLLLDDYGYLTSVDGNHGVHCYYVLPYKSTAIGNRQTTSLSVSVTTDRTLSFKTYWKVSSEENCDFLTRYVDGVRIKEISGDYGWVGCADMLSAGSHTLSWTYSKDGLLGKKSDCGWVVLPSRQDIGLMGISDVLPNIYAGIMEIDLGNNDCTGLVGFFAGCTNILKITYNGDIALNSFCPDSYKRISCVEVLGSHLPDGVFGNCSGLETVIIGNNVTNIGKQAFYGCSMIRSVAVGADNPSYSSEQGMLMSKDGRTLMVGINGDVTIPGSVTSIWENAFRNHSGLTSVLIPSSVRSIGANAFDGCENVREATVPGWQCGIPFNNVTNLVVSEGTLSIGADAFSYRCNGVKCVTIPDSVTNISDRSFSGCAGIERIYTPIAHADAFATYSLDGKCIWTDATTGGDAEWMTNIDEVHEDGIVSWKSGAITHNQESWFEMHVNHPGRLSFWWKSSSESDGADIYDYAYLSVDGEAKGSLTDVYRLEGVAIGGKTDWVNVVIDVSGAGPHTIRWTYCKDDRDDADTGEDCVWLDDIAWTPIVPVIYDITGASGATPTGESKPAGMTLTLPDATGFSWTDHVFNGWNDGKKTYLPGDTYIVPRTDVTFTAQWIRKSALTFALNGGSGTAPMTIKEVPGTKVTLPFATGLSKAKHTFAGWSDGVTTYDAEVEYVIGNQDVEFAAVWTANTLAAPVISSADVSNGGTMDSAYATIAMSAEVGAEIRYTTDGSVPTAASPRYITPFWADGLNVTIKAIAVRDDYFDSDVVTFSFTRKPYSLSECLGLDGATITTGGDSSWGRVLGSEAYDGVAALKSGALDNSQTNWVQMTVSGPGTISFWWNVSSEGTNRGRRRDGCVFSVDGVEMAYSDGTNNVWTLVTVEVDAPGAHALKWAYGKNDNTTSAGDDCAWLAEVVWTQGADPSVAHWSIAYENLKGAANPNPSTYYEGYGVIFQPLSAVSGYTFAGWTPNAIPADATGDKIVTANWNWIPEDATVEASITGGKALNIDAEWVKTELVQRFGAGKQQSFIAKFGDNFAAALTKKTGKFDGAGKELSVWHDYVAGTDPTDANSTFKAKVEFEDGMPVVKWEPNLNSNGEARVYTVYGKADLGDAWHSPTNVLDHFFKVDVSMPTDGTVSFNVGGGSSVDPILVRVGQPIGDLPTPTRQGYDFLGWFTAAEGGAEITPETIVTDDMTIFAHWDKRLSADLVHRWSFNGDLTDSVGGQTATKVGNVTTGAEQYTLAGGSQGASYIDLGANVLPNDGSAVTLEMWVTQLSAQYYARIWDFGNTGDDDMYMGLFNKGFDSDAIVFRNSGVVVESNLLSPYTPGTEFYIAVVMTPQNNGSWKLDFYKKDSSGNTLRSYSATTTVASWTLLGRTQSKCYLGHAIGSAHDANASYNEFRIWKKAMTEEELTASAIAGPDADL